MTLADKVATTSKMQEIQKKPRLIYLRILSGMLIVAFIASADKQLEKELIVPCSIFWSETHFRARTFGLTSSVKILISFRDNVKF